jgi:hypothetical protein
VFQNLQGPLQLTHSYTPTVPNNAVHVQTRLLDYNASWSRVKSQRYTPACTFKKSERLWLYLGLVDSADLPTSARLKNFKRVVQAIFGYLGNRREKRLQQGMLGLQSDSQTPLRAYHDKLRLIESALSCWPRSKISVCLPTPNVYRSLYPPMLVATLTSMTLTKVSEKNMTQARSKC